MKKQCAVLVISGRTTAIKNDLQKRNFKWNDLRKSWAKFDDIECFDSLKEEGREIALKYLGNVLTDTFKCDVKPKETMW